MMAVVGQQHGSSGETVQPLKNIQKLQDYLCGWGAAFINITLTYPLNKVMFRQMLHGIDSQKAIFDLKTEGIRYLYRGILPPLFQKTGSAALMFGLYEQCQQALQDNFTDISPFLCLSTSAIIAGTVEAVLTPMERIQTLMQDRHYHQKFQNSFEVARELQKFGFGEYYRGLTPILLRNGPSNVLFFALRENVNSCFPEVDHGLARLVVDFAGGAVSGAIISTVFYPINVVKTHMQSHIGGQYMSFVTAFQVIFSDRDRSWRKMFYGVHVNYTRALLSWGIINASYGLLKKHFFPTRSPD